MASRTQIVCLHEGIKGRSIDNLFIRALVKKLDPSWIRPWSGNNIIRPVDCGGRSTLISRLPAELRAASSFGSNTTVMVWADLDHDMATPDQLKDAFWAVAKASGITKEQFDRVVFVFAKDRLENWVEYLNSGHTDEHQEGPRVNDAEAIKAANKLADDCLRGRQMPGIPPSLEWSCRNWRTLVDRMR